VSKGNTPLKRRDLSPYQLPLPTSAELAILSTLWNFGPSTVREVHNALSSKRTGYTTVLKQMQIMLVKGLVTRSECHRSHVYEPRFPKEQTQRELAGNLLRQGFDCSSKSLIRVALSSQEVSSAELGEIRHMLDQFEKGLRQR
jgi:BlaI family transcriptional regulator, penicillinase repressor